MTIVNKYQNDTTNSSIVFTQVDCTRLDDLHLMLFKINVFNFTKYVRQVLHFLRTILNDIK